MSTSSTAADDARSNGRAIAIICIGFVCLVTNDALAKWLTGRYEPLQIIFLRNLLAMPMIAVFVLSMGGPTALRSGHLKIHALRGLLWVCGAFAFFSGLEVLPLAEATTLLFTAPIFITALSVPLLGDQVGWRRWAAVIVGFLGVLVIVRPGAAAFQPASLYVLAGALFYALGMISARWIDRAEGFRTMMFYIVLFPLLYTGVLVSTVWQPLDMSHLPLFLALAVSGTLGMALISQAFRLAPAAVVSPFEYTALIWASLLGWLVWGEIPGLWTYAGAAVIIVSGIYIVLRETRRARAGSRASE